MCAGTFGSPCIFLDKTKWGKNRANFKLTLYFAVLAEQVSLRETKMHLLRKAEIIPHWQIGQGISHEDEIRYLHLDHLVDEYFGRCR